MKPLPPSVLKLLDTLPDALPLKIVLNTDGKHRWEVEVFSRYVFKDEPHECSPVPLREKAVRSVSLRKEPRR